MKLQPITSAWLALLTFSAASTLVSFGVDARSFGTSPAIGGVIILFLAWGKARIIAGRYLELAAAPGILLGFGLVLALFMLALFALYLAAPPVTA